MKWTELVPSEFAHMIEQDALCVVPMGSLERHGEHIPFGCDLNIVEVIAGQAALITPAVVFPGYYLGQVHEAACFTGTVNLPQALAVDVLAHILDSIAANGFKKIVILNGHGGNKAFLDYFSMSQLDQPRDYVLYIIDIMHIYDSKAENDKFMNIWESEDLGHACELETSIYMACCPGLVRLDLADEEAVSSQKRFAHMRPVGIHNAHWWYAEYPENVVGSPRLATEEKGKKALEILVNSTARALKTIQDDTVAPQLQAEFLERVKNKGSKTGNLSRREK